MVVIDKLQIRVRPMPDRSTGMADSPREFVWHGRLHEVRRVLRHHRVQKETWRVEAVPARATRPGIFDMSFDWRTGRWRVTRVALVKEVS